MLNAWSSVYGCALFKMVKNSLVGVPSISVTGSGVGAAILSFKTGVAQYQQ